jgi:hypothetical protein
MPLLVDRNWAIALVRADAFGRVIPLADGLICPCALRLIY